MSVELSTKVLVSWKCPPFLVYVKEEDGEFFAEAKQKGNEPLRFEAAKIKFGIGESLSITEVAEKVRSAAQDSLVAYPYPRKKPEEIWVYPGSRYTFIEIAAGKENLLKASAEIPVSCGELEKAINHFEVALKMTKKVGKDSGVEIEKAIEVLKNQLFFQKIMQTAANFLPNERETVRFKELISRYKDEEHLLEMLEVLVECYIGDEAYEILLSAFVNEEKEEFSKAILDFCKLSLNNVHAFFSLERAYTLLCLLESGKSEPLVGEIRTVYNELLKELSNKNEDYSPTCFICFNVEESDVNEWLEDNLVADMKSFGIKPIFSSWNLNVGANILEFQEKAHSADLTLIACTPALKIKSEKYTKGVAQELDLIKSRLYDNKKENKTFPIYLKSSRKESLPTAYFSATLGSKFALEDSMKKRSKFNYFYYVFQLFAAMKEIPREEARKTQKKFLDIARNIMIKVGE